MEFLNSSSEPVLGGSTPLIDNHNRPSPDYLWSTETAVFHIPGSIISITIARLVWD